MIEDSASWVIKRQIRSSALREFLVQDPGRGVLVLRGTLNPGTYNVNKILQKNYTIWRVHVSELSPVFSLIEGQLDEKKQTCC
jgi:hypothetical protein